LVEDLAHLPTAAAEALRGLRKDLQRFGGVPRSRLKACQEEGRDGTRLPGCVKTYVPWPDGRFGAIFAAVAHPDRPIGLRMIAFGVRHHPRGSTARTVYEVAHERLQSR
jgi:hypothetical protein